MLMYNFDNVSALGESDTLARDVSIYGNDATCSGSYCPAWTPDGKYGGAFQFNGANNVLSIDNMDLSTLTFSAWIKRNSANLPLGEGLIHPNECGGWGVGINADNVVYLDWLCNFGAGGASVFIDDTDWHHVAVTYDGTGVAYYIDGIASGSSAFSASFDSGGAGYHVGQGWPPNGQNFNGAIDEVRIFNAPFPQRR